MALKCGIVGLPNVGKSTLFNALTGTSNAEAANYPFCTIEPNSGIVSVPDDRLTQLAAINNSGKIIPAFIEFVDIAGLVKGASKGEGLGNKFLSHIREVDAIIHVLRCFEDQDITHVHGNVDPVFDAEIIETELIIADIESITKRLPAMEKKLKSGDKNLANTVNMLKDCLAVLEKGQNARIIADKYDPKEFKEMQLLTAKPILYVCNVLEEDAASGNHFSEKIRQRAEESGDVAVVISSKIEEEIAGLDSDEEKQDFLSAIGLAKTGLATIIKASYDLLSLKSFFTVGPKEAHAWTFKFGTKAPAAAGIIHTDFEKGFIRAEIISFEKYIQASGEVKAKEQGWMRLEGKEYVMEDGDVVHFRFNV